MIDPVKKKTQIFVIRNSKFHEISKSPDDIHMYDIKLSKNNLNKKCAPKLLIRIRMIRKILDNQIQILALFDEKIPEYIDFLVKNLAF